MGDALQGPLQNWNWSEKNIFFKNWFLDFIIYYIYNVWEKTELKRSKTDWDMLVLRNKYFCQFGLPSDIRLYICLKWYPEGVCQGSPRVCILGALSILASPVYNSPPPISNCSLDIPCLLGLSSCTVKFQKKPFGKFVCYLLTLWPCRSLSCLTFIGKFQLTSNLIGKTTKFQLVGLLVNFWCLRPWKWHLFIFSFFTYCLLSAIYIKILVSNISIL